MTKFMNEWFEFLKKLKKIDDDDLLDFDQIIDLFMVFFDNIYSGKKYLVIDLIPAKTKEFTEQGLKGKNQSESEEDEEEEEEEEEEDEDEEEES